jgi:lysozyme family protein/peptidoglycan hydrolase-like protein with peptidoglycan-binding domain
MTLTPDLTSEYRKLWGSCAIRPQRSKTVDAVVDRILANKARYVAAGKPAGVPWQVVAIIHNLESSGNFKTHLHNGDPLTARTVQVPKGRPAAGSPPFTWEQSAADALALQKLNEWKDWSVPGMLYVFERYNGFGYRKRKINSPYLWSFSSNYTAGKYVADGQWSPTAVSEQCGAAVVLRRLAERGQLKLGGVKPPPPNDAGILLKGSKGPRVAALKKQLRAWFDKSAPGEWAKFGIADNDVFGGGVDKAVRTFQARSGLLVDGEVGPKTLAALKAKPGRPKAPCKDLAFPGPIKDPGSGVGVRLVQGWLSLHGFQVVVDGGFGPATAKALRDFQAKRGLAATGEVDEATYAALFSPLAGALARLDRPRALGPLVVAYAKQHLKAQAREIGGQNRGPWVRLYTDGREGNDYPWCAGFATYVLRQACETLGVAMPVQQTLGCDVMAATAGTRFFTGANGRGRLGPGSFFLQQAKGAERQKYRYRHTGIVVSAGPDTMQTIEGNTNDDGSAEGYEVCARTRGYADMDFVVL